MDGLLGGVPGVIVFQDDILIASASIEEHLATIEGVFRILAEKNLKCGKEKCQYFSKEVSFLGHTGRIRLPAGYTVLICSAGGGVLGWTLSTMSPLTASGT